MRGAAHAFLDLLVAKAAQPVEPVSVSFGPSTGPDWSLSVMVEDLGCPDGWRRQNDEPSFWSARSGR